MGNDEVLKLTLIGNPATKKNSQEIKINWASGKRYISQSDRYLAYERDCLWQIGGKYKQNIDYPINLKCIYFRKLSTGLICLISYLLLVTYWLLLE